MNWTTKFEQFSRLKHWRDWKKVAADADRWMMEADEFIKFSTPWSNSSHRLFISSYFSSRLWFFTFVTVCLRSKKQNKQHYNCLALFSTVARFELEPQIRETQSYQTSSSGNMPRRNLHCKYYVLIHITIQALEATQSHNAPSLTMLTLYHCKLQLRPFHFEVW